jgi:hypothetical protein
MKAWETPVGVALGAGVMVMSDVVTLMDSCEDTEEIEVILDYMEPRNLSGFTGMWMDSDPRATPQYISWAGCAYEQGWSSRVTALSVTGWGYAVICGGR